MEAIEKLQKVTALQQIFAENLWQKLFSKKALREGSIFQQKMLISGLEVYQDKKKVTIYSDFEDLNTYFCITLSFKFSSQGTTLLVDCDCYYNHCKHAAATLYYIASGMKKNLALKASGLDYQTHTWLENLEQVEKENASPEAKKKSGFLAYCLVWDEERNSAPKLVIHKGKSLKRGDFIDTRNTPAADPAKPSSFMENEDLLPCLLAQNGRDLYMNDVDLRGRSGYDLLNAILPTKRLFHLKSGTLDSNSIPNPVTLAKSITVKPTWEINTDGSKSPTLGLADNFHFIPCSPPYVLEVSPTTEKPSSLHPVNTKGKSARYLETWRHGPRINTEKTSKTSTAIKKISSDLPSPPKVTTKKIPKSAPINQLRLYRKNPFTHGGHHFSGAPEPIIAELSFDYNNGCVFSPDLREKPPKKATFMHQKGKQLLDITRDTKEELKAFDSLVEGANLVPTLSIDINVQPQYYSSLLPFSEPRSWDMLTADFIENAVPMLRAAGWKITIDSSAEFEITHVEDEALASELVESEGTGIDWFQFNSTYTTDDGKSHSVIPFLSEIIEQINIDEFEEIIAKLDSSSRLLLSHPQTGEMVSFPKKQIMVLAHNIIQLFGEKPLDQPLHRIEAAGLADALEMDSSDTLKALAKLGNNLKNIDSLPKPTPPTPQNATLRDYQIDGFHWMQFLARHSLNGILADDMGLGKTLQALTHIQAEVNQAHSDKPSLVIAPTSVIANWAIEAEKFFPQLSVLILHGAERKEKFDQIPDHHLILTTYPLIVRDFDILKQQDFHLIILDEAQYIKNHAAKASQCCAKLKAAHKLSLSGTPLENHLGELWSQMRFLMPGILGSLQQFTKTFRTPIEKHKDGAAQRTLNNRVAPLLLRRTKEKVAKELPKKTTIIQTIPLNDDQIKLYETVRASMDDHVRSAIADKGLAKSQIIVLDALLKLRQICCHPQLLKHPAAQKVKHSAKLDFLTNELLPQLLEEGRKILIFSTFTSMLAIIEEHIKSINIPFSKITGSTKKRQQEIEKFQDGDSQIFLISLKAGGTGLNLTAADTVIHYDPWWNPAAENQATDRAHRIGQDKPVFVHKLISQGSIEEKIQILQAQKSALVESLLTEETAKLKIDKNSLSKLLAPL